jgi:hypothetical protein
MADARIDVSLNIPVREDGPCFRIDAGFIRQEMCGLLSAQRMDNPRNGAGAILRQNPRMLATCSAVSR